VLSRGSSKPVVRVARAYWVCPLIEESEELRFAGLRGTAAALAEALPGLRRGAGPPDGCHPRKRDEAMLAFKDGKIHLLVATTVIEVGVDVPNCDADGLSKTRSVWGLHSFTSSADVFGRGTSASTCVAFVPSTFVAACAGKAKGPFARQTMGLRLLGGIWSCAGLASCSVPVRQGLRSCAWPI